MDAQSAMTILQNAPIQAPGRVGVSQSGDQTSSTGNKDAAIKAAKEFESVFISQFMGSMFSGIKADSMFGGGEGEEMFRSLMIDQYGKQIEQRGGFGLAESVTRQLLKNQEAVQ